VESRAVRHLSISGRHARSHGPRHAGNTRRNPVAPGVRTRGTRRWIGLRRGTRWRARCVRELRSM